MCLDPGSVYHVFHSIYDIVSVSKKKKAVLLHGFFIPKAFFPLLNVGEVHLGSCVLHPEILQMKHGNIIPGVIQAITKVKQGIMLDKSTTVKPVEFTVVFLIHSEE